MTCSKRTPEDVQRGPTYKQAFSGWCLLARMRQLKGKGLATTWVKRQGGTFPDCEVKQFLNGFLNVAMVLDECY